MAKEQFDFPAIPRPLTKKETAAYFSVTERTIDRWLLDGTLPENAKFVIGGSVRFRLQVLEQCMSSLSGAEEPPT